MKTYDELKKEIKKLKLDQSIEFGTMSITRVYPTGSDTPPYLLSGQSNISSSSYAHYVSTNLAILIAVKEQRE